MVKFIDAFDVLMCNIAKPEHYEVVLRYGKCKNTSLMHWKVSECFVEWSKTCVQVVLRFIFENTLQNVKETAEF